MLTFSAVMLYCFPDERDRHREENPQAECGHRAERSHAEPLPDQGSPDQGKSVQHRTAGITRPRPERKSEKSDN